MSALIERYYASAEWRSLADGSKDAYRRQYERFRQEYGAAMVQLTTKHVNLILDRHADRPAAANNLRDRLSVLMKILPYTGLRRSDAVRLGRQHVVAGSTFVLTTVHSQGRTELTIPIHPNLRPVLASVPAEHLTYIVTACGAARSFKGFTNWLREAATAAGLPAGSSPQVWQGGLPALGAGGLYPSTRSCRSPATKA